jgi:hypothetical protein
MRMLRFFRRRLSDLVVVVVLWKALSSFRRCSRAASFQVR